MIIDKLAEKSPWVRDFCDRSQLIQAPFAVLPPHESTLATKNALIPRHGKMISGQFAKPPFARTVIFGNGEDGQEQGVLLVESASLSEAQSHLLLAVPDDTTHVLTVTVTGLTQRFPCLVAYRFIAFCGQHFSSYQNVPLVTELSSRAFVQINGFEPSEAGAEIKFTESDWKEFLPHQAGSIAALFALLSCANIVKEANLPAKKQQRARLKARKLPLYRYHFLKLGSLKQSGNGEPTGQTKAIHWVRGHFKEFTPERPLFGKVTGLFWWQPHLVGQASQPA
jgi:hypothetical protein